jgi:hypothetical protein
MPAEQEARQLIDQLLTGAGWQVCDLVDATSMPPAAWSFASFRSGVTGSPISFFTSTARLRA